MERAECTSHNSLSLSLSAPLPPLARTRGDVFYLGKNLTTSNSCDFPVGETPLFAGADGHVWALGAPSEESDLRAALRCTGKGRQYQQQRDLFVRSLKITQREISLERRGGVYEKIFTFKKDFYFAVVCGFFFFLMSCYSTLKTVLRKVYNKRLFTAYSFSPTVQLRIATGRYLVNGEMVSLGNFELVYLKWRI